MIADDERKAMTTTGIKQWVVVLRRKDAEPRDERVDFLVVETNQQLDAVIRVDNWLEAHPEYKKVGPPPSEPKFRL
jgi:hypothetical protein